MDPFQLRPRRPGDAEFLYALYASTRAEELAPTGWSAAQKEAFLRSQFYAQTVHYDRHYAAASFDVVEQGGMPIGRLYVERQPSALHIVDIALLPSVRGGGLGTRLLAHILEDAARSARKVSIHVEQGNRARRLYERLGFTEVEAHSPYFRMEWSAPSSTAHPKTAS